MRLDEVHQRIDSIIDPFQSYLSYPRARESLMHAPPGFRYVFALWFVDADIKNGGIYQLYSNSTWCLIPDAVEGAEALRLSALAQVLREIIYYYHRGGRSKLKRRLSADYFTGIRSDWSKTLAQLEDEFYAVLPPPQQSMADLLEQPVPTHPNLFAEEL